MRGESQDKRKVENEKEGEKGVHTGKGEGKRKRESDAIFMHSWKLLKRCTKTKAWQYMYMYTHGLC